MTQTVLLKDAMELVTDYVANGSFASLKQNVHYRNNPSYAVLLRLVDYNSGYKNDKVWVDEDSYRFLKKSSVLPGDIIIANVGANAGTVFKAPDLGVPMTLGPNSVLLRSKKSNAYFYYWLSSPDGQAALKGILSGSAQPKFNKTDLRALRVPDPDIETQERIADILGTIDEKIELNRQMNETLEQMGQALFRHYFIDNPEAEKWEDGKFADVSEVLTGKGSTKSQLSESGRIPLYGANGVMGTSEGYLYDEPVVITGRVGTLGKVRSVNGKAWFSDNVLIMKPKDSNFGFVLFTAKSFDYISMNRGSSQPLITQTDLRNRHIKLPDSSTLATFESQYEDIFNQQKNNEAEVQTLITLRDTLLPRLISGKVKV